MTIKRRNRKKTPPELWLSNSPEYRLWNAAKYRCQKNGREFDIEISDIKIPTHCPVLGTPILKLPQTHPDYNRDNSPSLDRTDNNKGYTKDNIVVMSFRANSMKSNYSLDELKKLVKYLSYAITL